MKIEFKNGQVKRAFKEALVDFYNGEVSLEDLELRKLSFVREEDYFQAAGVRSFIQWLNGDFTTTDEELEEMIKEDQLIIIVSGSQVFKASETQNYLDPKE